MPRSILALPLLALLAIAFLGGPAAPPSSASPVEPTYGLHSLRGAYGFTYDGTVSGLGPVASSGRIDFDGAGGLSAAFTTSVGGIPFTGTFTGTYTVNPDGTGSAVIELPWLATRAGGDFVIVERGQATFFTATDPGYSVSGRTARM